MIEPRSSFRWALVLALATSFGCSGPAPETVVARKAFSQIRFSPPKPAAERAGGGDGKRRATEAATYVDGVPVGILRFSELPPSLPVRWKTLDDGRKVRRFRVAEYVTALGVDLARVQAVHLYGGRDRISIVAGPELRRVRDDLLFAFTQSDRGKPRMHYPPKDAIEVNTFIDGIDNIAIYVDKKPPRYDLVTHKTSYEDGAPIVGMPYAVGERPGGTRVYVDGVLRSWIKRKTLPDRLIVGGETAETRLFSLPLYLAWLGEDVAKAKAIEVVAGEEVKARYSAKELQSEGFSLDFTMPPKSRGQVQVELPEGPEKISAVRFYLKTDPPEGGSLTIHDGNEKPAEIAGSHVARALQPLSTEEPK